MRTGANAFIEGLLAAGVRYIFGNPGTTEQLLVDSLQEYKGIELILALHEGVAVGAAEGYARATGAVGVVELHAGSGLGNGLGMLYNARVGRTPLLVYVGQSEQRALYLEPTLSGDLLALAHPLAKWAYEARTTEEIPQVLARGLKVAHTLPCGPVVISVPMDLMEQECLAPVFAPSFLREGARPDPIAVDEAARALLQSKSPALLVGDGVEGAEGRAEISRLSHLTGAPIYGGFSYGVPVEPGETMYAGRLSTEAGAAERALSGFDLIVAVGTKVLSPQMLVDSGGPVTVSATRCPASV